MPQTRMWKEGAIAGLLGAAGVAFWFLVVDLVNSQALATPAYLGRSLFSALGKGIDWSPTQYVVAYTIFHCAVFVLIGTIVSAIVTASKHIPGVLAGLLLLFVVFEVGFYGLTVFMSEGTPMGSLAWYQIGGANLFAALLMGSYLWKEHPEIAGKLNAVLEGKV